ncbi:MAG: cell division protein FtsB [Pseudonocardiales bacterium]|nr:DUF3618 domain-containing protein [Actinomycetota bacterium]PZS23114.1 MAG: cell division protein FtsB [Pseudonocardiales bacterium]
MARDADTIERDIVQARDALAATLEELGTRPRRAMEAGKDQVEATMEATLGNPTVRYSLMGIGALIVLVLLRKLLR